MVLGTVTGDADLEGVEPQQESLGSADALGRRLDPQRLDVLNRFAKHVQIGRLDLLLHVDAVQMVTLNVGTIVVLDRLVKGAIHA